MWPQACIIIFRITLKWWHHHHNHREAGEDEDKVLRRRRMKEGWEQEKSPRCHSSPSSSSSSRTLGLSRSGIRAVSGPRAAAGLPLSPGSFMDRLCDKPRATCPCFPALASGSVRHKHLRETPKRCCCSRVGSARFGCESLPWPRLCHIQLRAAAARRRGGACPAALNERRRRTGGRATAHTTASDWWSSCAASFWLDRGMKVHKCREMS